MKTPLAIRNNNPLNIRFSPMNDWLGQVGSNKGFCVFDTMEHGYRAALVLLCNYQRKGYDTISKIIERWAPRSENNTKAYISSVCVPVSDDSADHGIRFLSPDERITSLDTLNELAYEMAKVEIGRKWLHDHFGTAKVDSLFSCYGRLWYDVKLPAIKK